MGERSMTADTPGTDLLFEIIESHIALVILNRPAALNAINPAITQELEAIVKRVEQDKAIRVAILASSSERAFCAGADLKEIAAGRGPLTVTPDGGFAGFVDAPREKPWIAAVNGFALGGGCELALACDMIIASQDATFGLPEVKRGLYAGAGGVFRIARCIPRNIALELIATGRSMDATRAAALGLVNLVTKPDELRASAIELARAVAANAPLSVRESMKIARMAHDRSTEELRVWSDRASRRVFASEDAREGPAAFIEKRAPHWTCG
jgi:enoyl-CoA hydratase/carnithine racemase